MTIQKLVGRPEGCPPLEDGPAWAAVTEDLTAARSTRDTTRPRGRRGRIWPTDAYQCSRKIAYRMAGVPQDIELTADSFMTFQVGDWYHDLVQKALVRAYDAVIEVPIDYRPRLSLSGYTDAIYESPEHGKVVAEIKSISGFGFDLAVGLKKQAEGPGPKPEHVAQAAVSALAPQVSADSLHIIYINKDRQTFAEWLVGMEEPLAHLCDFDHPDGVTPLELGETELARLKGILGRVEEGDLPRRFIPGVGLIDDPPPADSRQQPWNCRYCAWQPTCAAQPSEVVTGALLPPPDLRVVEGSDET